MNDSDNSTIGRDKTHWVGDFPPSAEPPGDQYPVIMPSPWETGEDDPVEVLDEFCPLPETLIPQEILDEFRVEAEKVVDEEINPKDICGAKKPPLNLVSHIANMYESVVMACGAYKYGPFNWRTKKVLYTIYIAACLRHLGQAMSREEFDDQSFVSHLAHARACLGIMLDAHAYGCLVDDRPECPVDGVATRVINECADALEQMYAKLREDGVPRFDEVAPLP